MCQNDEISFRKLEENDIKLLYKWLNTEFVIEWYGKKNNLYDEIVKKYLPIIGGEVPTYSFIIEYECKDIGYIQTYLIEDYPEYSHNTFREMKEQQDWIYLLEKKSTYIWG